MPQSGGLAVREGSAVPVSDTEAREGGLPQLSPPGVRAGGLSRQTPSDKAALVPPSHHTVPTAKALSQALSIAALGFCAHVSLYPCPDASTA